jgi:tRNA dimethylallyltransferase
MQKNIFIISGPTATGKTQTSIELAKMNGAEIINFDSLYFYSELSIGSARPSTEEMQGIPHHLVGTHSIAHPLNAADFMREAIELILQLHQQNITPILVGGSGFYLQTVLKGMPQAESTPSTIIERSNNLYQAAGIAPFLEELNKVDPDSASRLHPNDHYRIRRAVEFFWTNKRSLTESQLELKQNLQSQSPAQLYGWEFHHFHLDIPKFQHQSIIEQRVDSMLQAGLIQEVQSLLEQGFTGNEKPLQSIGYKEVIQYLKGEIPDIDSMRNLIIIATRQLAKAQRTWFAKIENKLCFNPLTDNSMIRDEYIKLFKR